MKLASFALGLLVAAPGITAQSPGMESWRDDLKVLAHEIPARHPDAFFRMSRSSWDSAVKALDARLPSLTKNQATVAFMQLVAKVRDGHTSINPLFDQALEMHYYPIELYLFSDGLYVRAAAPQYATLAGARVIRLGESSAEDAVKAAASTIGHENEWFARSLAPGRLILAEILDGLGIAKDANSLTLVVEKNGRRETVTLEPAGRFVPSGHNPLAGPSQDGWTNMRAAAAPLWQRNAQFPYWSEYVAADSTLYVSYRATVSIDHLPNAQFWRNVFAAADSLPVNRFVIDLRENPGGNSFYNRQVVRGILARPQLDQPGKLFAITSGRTFSAAMNLVQDLEFWTNVTLVGEPTGNATMFFGDHQQVRLPVSGITVNVSTLPWHPVDPRDRRDFIAPRIHAPMSAADYRNGVDPAMRAIASRGRAPSLASQVERAVLAGDTVNALNLVTVARENVENRFHSPESEINALGYRLVDSNRRAAIAIFRINTRAFAHSANTWDSLGEALILDGQRDAGIAAYRKALELSPGYASALAALQRLGVPKP